MWILATKFLHMIFSWKSLKRENRVLPHYLLMA